MTPRAVWRALEGHVGEDISVFTVDGLVSIFRLRPRVHRTTVTGEVFKENGSHPITVACEHITMITLPGKPESEDN